MSFNNTAYCCPSYSLFTLGQCIGEWLLHDLKSCYTKLLGSVINYENVDYNEVGSAKNVLADFLPPRAWVAENTLRICVFLHLIK